MNENRTCLSCNSQLEGRTDKKFCDPYCKSNYHYTKAKKGSGSFYSKVDSQLKTNRRILKAYNKAGKATVRANILIEQGFNPRYFTHYWKNKKADVYLFVYEYGFLSRMENGQKKFVLIKWQDFMKE